MPLQNPPLWVLQVLEAPTIFACRSTHPPSMNVPHLTPRELQVLHLLCDIACWLEKEMPDLLGMTLSTFKSHKENLFRKFKVHNRQELLVQAVRLGLVPCYCQAGQERIAADAAAR